MVPGPELGALLAGIDISTLTGSDVVEVLRARARQLSHEQAKLLATMVEVGICDPAAGPGEVARLEEPSPYAADEIRAALAWTRRAAEREYEFARTLVARMPAVLTALDAGRICRSKTWVFTDLCTGLTAEQTDVVCARLLPDAGRLTTGELATRIKKLAIALDPDWAARRYATATRERNVIGYLNEDGTATVTGSGLPVEEAAAACARVEDLARAAKQAGHPARLGTLRADIYLGLLDGRWQHTDRDQIVADLLSRAGNDGASAEGYAADEPLVDGSPDPRTADAVDPAPPADPAPPPSPAPPTGPAPPPSPAPPAEPARVGVELRVALSTLLGLDRHPGEITGWGPVTAEIARTVMLAQRSAEWRFAVTDSAGQLLHAGITRRRPLCAPEGSGPPPCRGGIVELHIPATLLTQLTADPDAHGEWAPVIADIALQYTRRGTAAPGNRAQDPTARFAGAALRRHVQIRDRFCVFVGCRCPAHRSDLDHTVDYAAGGATTEANSGPACQHDHRLKHVGGWRLHQSQPGHFTWTSPLGRQYHTQPPPITTDLPEPLPRPRYPDDVPARSSFGEDRPILERPPPQPPPPEPAEAPDPDDEPPPF